MIKEIRNIETNELVGYLYNGMTVPLDSNNRHYQEIQELIKNGGKVLPAFSLDDLKEKKINEIKTIYQSKIQEPISYLNTEFQADKESQLLINNVLTASGGTLPKDFFWLDINNNQIVMSYMDLQGLANAILLRNQQLFTKYQTLKSQVLSATSEEDLDLITWD